jgi:hypothetical protein
MPSRTLHFDNKDEVSSFQKLDLLVDAPEEGPRHLLIFTGIAAARWDSKRDLDPLTVIVTLGANVEEPPPEHAWTAVVGLSNINNVDSDFIYAINAVTVDTDKVTTELFLSVDIAVQGAGGRAVLDSFTFQVTVLTEPPKVELDQLLIKGGTFAPTASTLVGLGWEGVVILKAPAPRAVDVFISSANPTVAPLTAPGDPSFRFLTIKRGESTGLFAAPATSLPANIAVTVNITAALGASNSTAVLTVTPPPN